MKISTRLNTGFGAGMLIVAIIGFISTVNLSNLNNQVEKIVQTLYPTTAYANTLISEINNVFVEQSAFLSMKSRKTMRQLLKRLRNIAARWSKIWISYSDWS